MVAVIYARVPDPYVYERDRCRVWRMRSDPRGVEQDAKRPSSNILYLHKEARPLAMEDWSIYGLVDASGRPVSLPPKHFRSVELAMRAQLPAPDRALVNSLSIRMHVSPIGWVVGFYRKEMAVSQVLVWVDEAGRVW